ncbi:MAG TPA: nuclear transport factor 2 family protein [Chitinophagaceae bacterium]
MKRSIQFLVAGIIICSSAVRAQSIHKADEEKIIKKFWAGFEKKDWNIIASQLSDDFTFTSPNDDDHIPASKFKEKCWANGIKFFKNIEYNKITVDGKSAFVMYTIHGMDNQVIHNVEYYTFSNGKLKSIETFFGPGMEKALKLTTQ